MSDQAIASGWPHKLLWSLILTFLFYLLLLGGHFGLGFTLINFVFLFLLTFEKPQIYKNPIATFAVLASATLGVFSTLRDFGQGHFLTIGLVFLLNSLAAVNFENLSIKAILAAPCLILLEGVKRLLDLPKLIKFSVKDTGTAKKNLGIFVTGVFIAVPLVGLFLLLFTSADPLFTHYVQSLIPKNFTLDLDLVFKTLEIILVFGLFNACFTIVKRSTSELSLINEISRYRNELAIACVFVILLTASFLVVQAQYILASAQDLKQMGVMLSEYTRRGYSELLVVSTISLALISLITHRSSELKKNVISTIAWVFLAEVLLVLLSASRRVYMYQDIHGFTVARVLGVLFSVWLLGILVIYGLKLAKVLAERQLVFAGLITTVAVVLLMNLVNVDYVVAVWKQPNLGYGIDYPYIAITSEDGWQGWESVIKNAETQIAKCEPNRSFRTLSLSILGGHYGHLRRMSANNWHNLGGWTVNQSQAYGFLKDNRQRINKDYDGLLKCEGSIITSPLIPENSSTEAITY